MDISTPTTEYSCPREELSLYVDGELSPDEELLLEKHLAECEICLTELNFQKQMLSALDFAFEKREEIELPKDFTKVVVTKAESNVKGLRCRRERLRALYFCLALFLFISLGFGSESEKVFATINAIGNQVFTLGSFFVHLSYDLSIGIAVILRSLSQKISFSNIFILLILVFLLTVSIKTLPRFAHKFNRTRTS